MFSDTHRRTASDLVTRSSSSPSPHPKTSSSSLRRAVSRLAHKPWFADLGRRLAAVDRVLYRATSGGMTIMGPQGVAMPPTLLLTTIGRRTGRYRSTPVMYLRDADQFIITSENFGHDRVAAWPLNLAAHPRAAIQVRGNVVTVQALPATAEQRARYWPQFVELWPAHETYKRRSGVCNMFVLDPVSDVRATG